MKVVILFVIEFFIGAMMFSYWIGLLMHKDIRAYGEDENPGAFNLGRAFGFKFGVLGALLDFLKGLFPLILFTYNGWIKGWEIFVVGIAPILGHAFSPFLKFKGGKGVAVTFGVWSALTFFEVSFIYAVVLATLEVSFRFFKKHITGKDDAFITVAGLIVPLIYMYFRGFGLEYSALLVANFLVILYKSRKEVVAFLKRESG
jgi:acyl-phosphate glycerol 3-phosphate acyltransferase